MFRRSVISIAALACITACGSTEATHKAPTTAADKTAVTGLELIPAATRGVVTRWASQLGGKTQVRDVLEVSNAAEVLVQNRRTDAANGCRTEYTKLSFSLPAGKLDDEALVGAVCCSGDTACKQDTMHSMLSLWQAMTAKDHAAVSRFVSPKGITLVAEVSSGDTSDTVTAEYDHKQVVRDGLPGIDAANPMVMSFSCDANVCYAGAGGIHQKWHFEDSNPPKLVKVEQSSH